MRISDWSSDVCSSDLSAHRAFVEATGQWLSGDGSPRVETLIETTGLSARQVARLTNRLYGAPPKLLARKYRALRVASIIASSDDESRDIVGELFYDQSHLICGTIGRTNR